MNHSSTLIGGSLNDERLTDEILIQLFIRFESCVRGESGFAGRRGGTTGRAGRGRTFFFKSRSAHNVQINSLIGDTNATIDNTV
jgi:hypothetical protein